MRVSRNALFISLFIGLFINISGQQKTLNVVPQPKQCEFTANRFLIKDQQIQLVLYGERSEQIETVTHDLIFQAAKFCDAEINSNLVSDIQIHIGLLTNNNFKKIFPDVSKYHQDIGEEGYYLLIDSESIYIGAYKSRGLFYGIQTLKQILRSNRNNDYLEGLMLTDWPSFKYRAIMDDISRGPIPTLDFMKSQIQRLAEMKVNTMLHYVEHVVKTESHPEFAPDDGSLTIAEWKEISDYALKYNITIIGGFQSFGHFQNILSNPEYAHLGESGSLISPVLPESYEFLENIYREMIPAFNTEFYNINCDETFDLGKGASKDLVDSIGYAEVYYLHIKKLYDILKKYDKRVIMWGDILMQNPELLEKLPKDILIGTWDYDARETFEDFIEPFKMSGHEFWVVPGVLNTRSIYPDFNKAFGNIDVFVTEGFDAGASGVLTCFWDDGGTGLFSNDWYGAAYGADKSWNHSSNNSDFDLRYAQGCLASDNDNFLRAIKKINELRKLELTDGMKDRILFMDLLPEVGQQKKISTAGLHEINQILNETELLINGTELNFYSDDKIYFEFVINLYRTLADERVKLLKAAEDYSEAENIYGTYPFQARQKIIGALEIMISVIEAQEKLKQNFEILWLKENHTYALDWITDRYEEKINDFKEVKSLLLKSLKRIDSSKPMLSIENVRLSLSELPGKYFTEWMMINPLPNRDQKSISEVDYLADMGGEINAVPKVTQEFYFENSKYRWRRVVSKRQDIVDLNNIFPGADKGAVMYAFANISVEESTEVKALIGFSEGIEVFVNGISIFSGTEGRLKPDQTSFTFSLPEGKNNLMLKITKVNGEWGFSFRLPDSEVRNHKNRYKIIGLR